MIFVIKNKGKNMRYTNYDTFDNVSLIIYKLTKFILNI